VQLAHHLGGFDIYRVLVAERPLPDAKNETEVLDVVGELLKPESDLGVLFQIVQFKRLEIAYQNIPRKLLFLEAGKVVEGLFLGARQVAAGALLLDQEHSLPEQIDETALIAELSDRLLETGDTAAGDAKHLEKLVIEGLAFPALVMSVAPLLGETGGASPDLIPTEAYLLSLYD
jgi:hypothetical protein